MSIFFTADQHWCHENIIRFAHRPFASVDEMDEALIRNWNDRVGDNDDVYHLGDVFVRARRERAEEILRQLRGRIYLVRGNHDKDIERFKKHFVWVKDQYELKVPDDDAPGGKQRIMLNHCAFRVWYSSHYGSWDLYGHSHASLWDDPNARQIDVGVDCHNYAPISYDEVKALIAKKHFVPIDHHLGHGVEGEDET